jgi:tetratricopeptide (TPR) repeat protein
MSRRHILERHGHVREEHLRYMQKLGLVRPARVHGEVHYAFVDLGSIRHLDAELARGVSFRSVLRTMMASRAGQLAFDFRSEARPAKVLRLERRDPPPMAALLDLPPVREVASAEALFAAASRADDGDPGRFDQAMQGYRRALELDPSMVPALINLANIHYARDESAEAQALYERAIAIDPDVFEAHFNLGNIHHDRGRYAEATACYRDALHLHPAYAEAHFYMAVTLEKRGRSAEARAHWRAYQRLAPNGEWADLAREFSDG